MIVGDNFFDGLQVQFGQITAWSEVRHFHTPTEITTSHKQTQKQTHQELLYKVLSEN